jgi:hypothetical protein
MKDAVMYKASAFLKRTALVSLVALSLALFAAFGPSDGSSFPGEHWTLEWNAGGGIMRQSWNMTLDHTGKVVVTHLQYPTGPIVIAGTGPQIRTREGNIQPDEVRRLRKLMHDANLPALSKREQDFLCGDCYSTFINVNSGDKAYGASEFPAEEGSSKKLFDAIYDLFKAFEPAR